ncbi:hypothetical protein [Spirosoma fluviale]|uniref:hypothetical protein n=1 Tax=Spirosoma fluviale TaxID=1597977 RepID=UPI0015CAFD56|nr:hypothetical protein [Spirosoma fluviale]
MFSCTPSYRPHLTQRPRRRRAGVFAWLLVGRKALLTGATSPSVMPPADGKTGD